MFLENMHKVATTFGDVPIFYKRALNHVIMNPDYKNTERYAYAVAAYSTYFDNLGKDQQEKVIQFLEKNFKFEEFYAENKAKWDNIS